MKNCTKSFRTMNFFFNVRSPKTFLPILLLLLHPTNLVIRTLATIVAPTITMAATNNRFNSPNQRRFRPTTTLMMVYAASCATSPVMLQAFVDRNLTIILRPRLIMCQACTHQKILGFSTLEHLITSLPHPKTCRHTMAWSKSPRVMVTKSQ